MHDDFFRLAASQGEGSEFILPPPPLGLKWSKNIWANQRGNWIALYRPLNLGLVFFAKAALQELFNNGALDNQDIVQKLIAEKFLQRYEEKLDEIDHRHLVETARSGRFRFICILPTTSCNLACAYCHQRVPESKARSMTLDEIEQGLQKCASLCTDLTKPVDILLYGGEPLQAFPITERVLQLTRTNKGLFKQPVRISFTTSGFHLLPKQADLLAAHDVFVIVSIDGPPECQDRIRPSLGGGSSFEMAAAAFDALKARGCRVGLSVTIGEHNIRQLSEYLEFLLDRFQPNDIGLNAFLHRRGEHVNPYQVASGEAFDAFIRGFNVTRRYGVYAEQPFRRLKPFVFRKPLLKDCSAPGERLVLAPGRVMGFCDSCFPDQHYYYSFDNFPDENHPDFWSWVSLSSPEMPVCRSCPVMTVCGGACRYDAFKASGSLDGVDELRCDFERAFLNWMIWELFAKLDCANEPYCFPEDHQRKMLLGNVALMEENQPFTAGSYGQTEEHTPTRP
ncbi:MAG: radical SAM protein [bacterium]